ncbi:MAG TPA: hypothetical protein VK698_38195 [Kofleriaceae bacterium]|nr:hypothetical protein [Kofleriaceae bacterium]
MKSIALLAGLLIVAAILGSAAVDAGAAASQNINTHGATCKNYNAAQALDIDYLSYGVRNVSTGSRPVICSVERHPVTGATQAFYVDGTNSAGQATVCTLTSYNYSGVYQSSVSFSESIANYDHYATLPTIGYYDYVSLVCTLPPSGLGTLRGVVALDS